MNPKVDDFINNAPQWQQEIKKLREVLLDCGLTENFKWRSPCYSFQGHNVVIVQGFKEFCALMFFKGVLLKDSHGILKTQGKNTQAALRIPFTNVQEIIEMEPALKVYIKEAIEVEKQGLKVNFTARKELILVKELQKQLNEAPAFKAAFEALTPGRQRAYNMYFSQAKQAKTRELRIEKCIPKILAGKGLTDR